MKKAYADTPEGQVHYLYEGSGESILLLHQTSLSSDEYVDSIPMLAKRFKVVAMDTLGYGNSDKPPENFEIEDYVRNIIHFLDAIGIQKTSVAGHHTGATLAGELAASYPERVNKVIMSAPSLYTPEEREFLLTQPIFAPMAITDEGSFLTEMWNDLRNAYSINKLPGFTEPEDVDSEPPKFIDNSIVYRVVLESLKAGPRLHDAHFAAFRYDKAPKLPLIKSPILIMCGDKDILANKVEAVQKLIQGSKIRMIEGVGGAVTLVKPVEFAQVIMEFMDGSLA